MKYIDAEKPKRFVGELKERAKRNRCDSWGIVPDALEEVEGFIDSLQQEQPKVDLEKFTEKIKTFQGRYKHPEIVSIKGAMAFMARMFYQYPSVARQWYERLPKSIMD